MRIVNLRGATSATPSSGGDETVGDETVGPADEELVNFETAEAPAETAEAPASQGSGFGGLGSLGGLGARSLSGASQRVSSVSRC